MSDEKNETYADISAELRDLSRSEKLSIGAKYCEPQPMVGGKPIGIYFAELADRIEAAIERDRTSRHSIKIPIEVVPELAGNATEMRVALVALRDAARNFCHQILNSKYNDIMDEYKCRARGFPALLDLRYAIPKANVALSKPPRNCDRPECVRINDAAKVWYKEEIEPRVKGLTMGHKEMQLPDWLLAPIA